MMSGVDGHGLYALNPSAYALFFLACGAGVKCKPVQWPAWTGPFRDPDIKMLTFLFRMLCVLSLCFL